MSVTVRAKLPKGDANGLASWERILSDMLGDTPNKVIPVVALLQADTQEIRPHDADDPLVIKCVLVAIEATDGANAKTVDGLVHEIYAARTGKLTLPFEDGEED